MATGSNTEEEKAAARKGTGHPILSRKLPKDNCRSSGYSQRTESWMELVFAFLYNICISHEG